MSNKFYITTAIAYASRKPHVGNDFEIILTDSIARYNRLIGKDVFMLTGTDEHGQKIQELAEAFGITPIEYANKITNQIKENYKLLNISYDKFIRTTDDYHEAAVKKIFKKLYDKGDIYKSEYEGLYCLPCESFFTETQLKDGCCPDCGGSVTSTKEEAYFFKMSNYQERLMDYIDKNPEFIKPESRKNEMVNNFLKPGLQDLCVSRTSFKWGISVEFDTKHVIYVWIDALINYITALGYDPDGSGENFKKYWPCDLHVIGKDILRFHTIYWPIILMALDIELPKQILGHPWLMFGKDKMSKSKGNVMYSSELADLFGVDALRYFLLKEMPYAQDGTISIDVFILRFNSDLANTLGNLVNRTVAMVNKYFGGEILPPDAPEDIDSDLINTALNCVNEFDQSMVEFKTSDALEAIMVLARRSNKYIDETMPWVLAKDEDKKQRLATVLYNLVESIRFISIMISVCMPQTSQEIFKQINAKAQDYKSLSKFGETLVGSKVGEATPLFLRIDEAKMMKEIEEKLLNGEK